MGKKARQTRQRNTARSGGSSAAIPKKFTAPTPGLEDVPFTWGTTKDEAKFEDMISYLARYVGTKPLKLSSKASTAMSAIVAPVITEADRPTRKYWADSSGTAETNNKTNGTGNALVEMTPFKEEWEHDLNIEDFKIKRRAFQEQVAAWKDNKAKCCYLVLSHCPKELVPELRNSTKWAGTEDNRDVVALLKMIRDITHNKKERKESVTTIAKSDVELFTILQEPGQDLYNYYKVFKAQVDIINAHGGNAGHHPVVYMLHLSAKLKSKKIKNDAYVAMSEDDKKPIQAEATNTSKGAYFTCPFLLMADEDCYGGVKATLDDNCLLGKQEHPQYLLVAKRLLADFKGTGPKTKRKAAGSDDDQGVAFVKKKGGLHPYLPRVRQQVQRRLASMQEHHRGPQGQGGGAGRRGRLQEEDRQRQQQEGHSKYRCRRGGRQWLRGEREHHQDRGHRAQQTH